MQSNRHLHERFVAWRPGQPGVTCDLWEIEAQRLTGTQERGRIGNSRHLQATLEQGSGRSLNFTDSDRCCLCNLSGGETAQDVLHCNIAPTSLYWMGWLDMAACLDER